MSELGNIHQCGFVSGSVSFVGGIVGEPTAVKVFYDVAEVDSGTLCQERSRCYFQSLFLWCTYVHALRYITKHREPHSSDVLFPFL